jgi:3-phenylpropionate/trans-cinnamate dioxygenase ferredoxin reductase subunit
MKKLNVVVGAGQAGGWAAMAMRQAGFDGRIVLVGEEAHRPYERPPLSKTMLTEAEEPPVSYFHKDGAYEEAGIELMLGQRAASIDVAAQRVAFDGGGDLPYDRLLIATGGRARKLPFPNVTRLFHLRDLEDARRLRAALAGAKRVICIGAGVISLEVAASARMGGREVTVIEAAPGAMGRCVSSEGALYVEEMHRRAGVRIEFGKMVANVEDEADGVRVTCQDGSSFVGDIAVAGIGLIRNLELAEAAGLGVENGILVDELGRSSAPNVYAAGDVTAFFHPLFGRRMRLESWRHAQNHGIAVGKAMADQPVPYEEIPWFWTDQYKANIQVSGFPADGVTTIRRPGANQESFTLLHLDAAGIVVGVTAVNNGRDARPGQALIALRRPVDAAALQDHAKPLQALLKAMAA